MAKKRGKTKSKSTSKKHPKKAKVQKIVEEPQLPKVPLKEALKELEILSEEKKVENKISEVERKEENIEKKESQVMREEKKIEADTKRVEKLEEEIKKEVKPRPLTNLTLRDINKGVIGAFVGVVAHFAFIYGRQIAKDMTITRASILIIFSYILIVLLMYETGYREIREKRILGVFPKRATAIYLTSIIMIPIIFFLFNQLNLSDPVDLFKQIAVSSVFASIGAGTADIIGKN